jgi:hypothetical protein
MSLTTLAGEELYLLGRHLQALQNLLHAIFFLGLFLDLEDGGDIFLRNIGRL